MLARLRARLDEVVDIAIEEAIAREERSNNALDKAVEQVQIVSDCGLELIRRQVQEVLQDKAAQIAGFEIGQVGLKRDEVVQSVVFTQLARVLKEELQARLQSRREGEADAALKPVLREGLVEEERRDVFVAGVARTRLCSVGEKLVYEDAFGVRDNKPKRACELVIS